MDKDLLGRALSAEEKRVLGLYRETKELLRVPDLAPGVRANLRFVLSHLWQAVNDLCLEFEQLYDYNV